MRIEDDCDCMSTLTEIKEPLDSRLNTWLADFEKNWISVKCMEWKVEKWIRDNDLESTLNNMQNDGWRIMQLFRNAPGSDHLETTTIVAQRQLD